MAPEVKNLKIMAILKMKSCFILKSTHIYHHCKCLQVAYRHMFLVQNLILNLIITKCYLISNN